MLYDTDDRAYLDGVSGIAVTNLGHQYPRVTEAVAEQASRLIHTSICSILACRKLSQSNCAPRPAWKTCSSATRAQRRTRRPSNSRRYGDQKGIASPQIVVLDGAFHGRTLGALSATGNQKIRQGFGPLLEGFLRVSPDDLSAVDALAAERQDIVAVLVEPILGEGGIRPLSADFLQGLRRLCDQHEWLLIFDEVQTGNGRCGSTYVFEKLGVVPDVLLTANGLGNGLPIGVCMAKGSRRSSWAGDHGSPMAATRSAVRQRKPC